MSTMKSIASRHNGYDSYVSIAGNVTIDQAIMMRFFVYRVPFPCCASYTEQVIIYYLGNYSSWKIKHKKYSLGRSFLTG